MLPERLACRIESIKHTYTSQEVSTYLRSNFQSDQKPDGPPNRYHRLSIPRGQRSGIVTLP